MQMQVLKYLSTERVATTALRAPIDSMASKLLATTLER